MHIISWNVFSQNENIDAFISFVRETNADIYAFQELTEKHLAAIQTFRGYTFHKALDFIERQEPAYLGIMTRLPCRAPMVIGHNVKRRLSPSWIGRQYGWRECIESLSILVKDGEQCVRIINAHLACAASPRIRMSQLQQISQHFGSNRNIVLCGDFNTFARPWYNFIIGWFYGFGIQDIWTNENNLLNTFSTTHSMSRAFVNVVTFPRLRLHLDNMLVKGLRINKSSVELNTHGSDHRPIIATLEG